MDEIDAEAQKAIRIIIAQNRESSITLGEIEKIVRARRRVLKAERAFYNTTYVYTTSD